MTCSQPRYEYIRLLFDWGNLSELNGLSSVGWRVVSVVAEEGYDLYALLEREVKSDV